MYAKKLFYFTYSFIERRKWFQSYRYDKWTSIEAVLKVTHTASVMTVNMLTTFRPHQTNDSTPTGRRTENEWQCKSSILGD